MGYKEKILLFGVLPWLLVILSTTWLVIPSFSALGEKQDNLLDQEELLSSLTQRVDIVGGEGRLEDEVEQLKENLKGFGKEFPTKYDVETLYVDLQKILNATKNVVTEFSEVELVDYEFPKGYFDKFKVNNPLEQAAQGGRKTPASRRKAKKKELPVTVRQIQYKIKFQQKLDNFQGIVDLLYYLSSYYRFLAFNDMKIEILTNKPSWSETTLGFIAYKYRRNRDIKIYLTNQERRKLEELAKNMAEG